MRRLFLALAAMLVTNISAKAGEPGQPRYDCPNLYRSWKSTDVMERPGWSDINPQGPVDLAINNVRVFKDKAIVTWEGTGSKTVYTRQYHLKQTGYFFKGIASDGSQIEIDLDEEYYAYKHSNRCKYELYYIGKDNLFASHKFTIEIIK
jgi:hypothetical protein